MEIWDEIKADRERGGKRLIDEYGVRLNTAAFQITQNPVDAEDLVFRTFAYVVEKIDVYDGRCSFFSWLYLNMLNFRRMDLRRKGANALVFMDELPEGEDPAPDPAEALAISSTAEEVRMVIAMLPETLRTAVVLHYYEGMGVAEISRLTNVPVGTVKYRLFEARRKMSRSLIQTRFRKEAYNKEDEGKRQIRGADR